MAALSATSTQAMNALLTEHFRYTPLTLVDDIINTVNEVVYRIVTALEEGLMQAGPDVLGFNASHPNGALRKEVTPEGNTVYPDVQIEIEEGVYRLETLLEATVDKIFDRLELYVLRNILYVEEQHRAWVRLGHYDNIDLDVDRHRHSLEGLFEVRRKTQAARKLNDSLVLETKRNEMMLAELKKLTSSSDGDEQGRTTFAFLTASPSAAQMGISLEAAAGEVNHQPLTTATEAAIAQLPALRKLLAFLKQKALGLRPAQLTEKQAERADYIEGSTRRQLELGGANARSGEGLVGKPALGRRVGREEAQAMELIANMLGTSSDASNPNPDEMET